MRPVHSGNGNFAVFFFPYKHCSNRDIKGKQQWKLWPWLHFTGLGAKYYTRRLVIMLMLPGNHAKHGICQIIDLFPPQSPMAGDLCSWVHVIVYICLLQPLLLEAWGAWWWSKYLEFHLQGSIKILVPSLQVDNTTEPKKWPTDLSHGLDIKSLSMQHAKECPTAGFLA